MIARSRIVHLRREQFEAPPEPFRTGAAGLVTLDADGLFELEDRVSISANSTHGMLGHGLHERLNDLALEGTLGTGVPVMIRPALVEAARRILYEADRLTYGRTFDFLVETQDGEEGETSIEYRVVVDNRELQITLVRIIDVLNRASRHGMAAWIRI